MVDLDLDPDLTPPPAPCRSSFAALVSTAALAKMVYQYGLLYVCSTKADIVDIVDIVDISDQTV